MMKQNNKMKKIDIKPLFEKEYNSLWETAEKQFPQETLVRNGYDVVNHITKGALMIVGLNPSIGKEDKPGKFFETITKDSYKYYPPIFEFAENCGYNEFSYADIFAMRCSIQRAIIKNIKEVPGFKDFCKEQFNLFVEIVKLASPSIIVVTNAYARDRFFDEGKDVFKVIEDNEIGTYRIAGDSELEGVPVFFSGMLGGQHALDKGSKKRMEWQIRRIKSCSY